jgi:hypothetical protein
MIRVMFIMQLLLSALIIGFAIWRRRRAGRYTYLDTCILSLLLFLHVSIFAFFGASLDRQEAQQWGNWFPDGTHAFLMLFIGVFYAIVLGPINELFRWLQKNAKDGKTDE